MKIYQLDAFTDKIFSGNPAAICPLDEWLSDEIMLKIAAENNLAETAFYVKQGEKYHIRWFTPTTEVDLCGHATLATAYIIFNYENYFEDVIQFFSPRSGNLMVSKKGDLLTLNFPTDELKKVALTSELLDCFEIKPILAFKGKADYMLVFENETDIQTIIPNLKLISNLKARGVIVTAKGNQSDFVSRFFGPTVGVNEDPVTGSAHTTLIPFWAERLGKTELSAIQLSERKGHLLCKFLGDRVEISGQVKLYMKGEIFI